MPQPVGEFLIYREVLESRVRREAHDTGRKAYQVSTRELMRHAGVESGDLVHRIATEDAERAMRKHLVNFWNSGHGHHRGHGYGVRAVMQSVEIAEAILATSDVFHPQAVHPDIVEVELTDGSVAAGLIFPDGRYRADCDIHQAMAVNVSTVLPEEGALYGPVDTWVTLPGDGRTLVVTDSGGAVWRPVPHPPL